MERASRCRSWSRVCLTLAAIAASARISAAQQWTSTDVGAVGPAGSATLSADTWTVSGSGADIWGASDAFQFLHQTSGESGSLSVHVDDLQNTNAFAKAGLMIRASLSADAPMAIVDVKPDGGIEFMARPAAGPVNVVASGSLHYPMWLHIGWAGDSVNASISQDGATWTPLGSVQVALPSTPQAGLAVTSHDNSQLTTAHFDQLSAVSSTADWAATTVGTGGRAGSAIENGGVWSVNGGGSDIWGTADNFEFVYRMAIGARWHVIARIDDLQNTNAFAKAGVMMRASLDAGAAAVVLDVKPGGGVEFMARRHQGDSMTYLGGGNVAFPVWLQLAWNDNGDQTLSVTPYWSTDGMNWTSAGTSATIDDPQYTAQYAVGTAVTSHDTQQLATAHIDDLSVLGNGSVSTDVGAVALPGNGSLIPDPPGSCCDTALMIQGAGSDVWGSADAFQFVHGPMLPDSADSAATMTYRVTRLDNTSPYAKAGLMFRDTLDANAANVILDVKPDGGVEFMARLCGECATTFIAGTTMTFPLYLSLDKQGSTYSATVYQGAPGHTQGMSLGSVTLNMSQPFSGLAVTSHSPNVLTTAVFDYPSD